MVENKIKRPKCMRCRDKGLEGGCPKCGKNLKSVEMVVLNKHDGKMDDSNVLGTIPEYYRGKIWDKNIFMEYHNGDKDLSHVKHILSQMEKIHNIFINGKIPNKSIIMIAPKQYSKQIWAYSCIQFAHKNGYKVFPVMSSDLVKRVMTNMIEKQNSKFLKELGYNLEDILTADCLFVNIDTSWQRIQAYQVIDDLMCKRSNFDRPTIFLSRFGVDELCKADYDGTFKRSIVSDNTYNRLRYPAVIQ